VALDVEYDPGLPLRASDILEQLTTATTIIIVVINLFIYDEHSDEKLRAVYNRGQISHELERIEEVAVKSFALTMEKL
jgi:hypothetical protein